MTTKTMRIISSDSHVNEPPEIWAERLPEKLRHRAPHVEVRDGVDYTIVEGTHPRKNPRGRIQMEGEDLERAHAGGWDPAKRIVDQERDGVSAEVIYPSNGLNVFMTPDPELQIEMARVYNDWAHEVFGGHSDRFAVAALLPASDIPTAISEMDRVAKMGYRTLFMPVKIPERPGYNDPLYDPLWTAIQEAGLSVNFHAGTGHEPRGERGPGGAVINYLLNAQGDGPYIVTYLCASGVLQRFPNIHFVAVETGGAWLAWILQDMDLIYKDHHMWVNPKLDMLPSEYWRRQGHVGFQNDKVGVANRGFTGVETLLWGNDYPHHEGTWPNSQQAISEMFKDVPEEETQKMIGGTAAIVYGFN